MIGPISTFLLSQYQSQMVIFQRPPSDSDVPPLEVRVLEDGSNTRE